MGKEIERKFLVCGDFKKYASEQIKIIQAYLSSNPERTVRIRIAGKQAFLTIKGISNNTGITRYEWEKEIDLNEANELLRLCEPGIIEKTRFCIHFKNKLFEVDEFHSSNKGLVIAELELENENESFEKPDWLGKEVTGDEKYYNAYLSKLPFQNW